jgi:hypothetical protein
LRTSDGRLLVRVRGGRKIMHPADYASRPQIPDCVGAVRRAVVDEWLEKRDDYFSLEVHQWFTFHMHHSMLFIDEPWTRYNVGGADRVTLQPQPQRQLDDYVKFLDEHLAYVEGTESVVLDELLEDAWFGLWRAGRKEDAMRFAQHMEKRGLSKRSVIARRGLAKARRLLPVVAPPVRYVE